MFAMCLTALLQAGRKHLHAMILAQWLDTNRVAVFFVAMLV